MGDTSRGESGDGQRSPVQATATPPPAKSGVFDRLLSFFTDMGDPDREKKRLIKEIGKRLKQQKQRFYNPKNESVLSGLPTFFFGIYKTVSAAQSIVGRAESSAVLKSVLVEAAFTVEQREIVANLQEESIRKRVQQTPPKVLAGQLKEDLVSLLSGFDSETVKSINLDYNRMMAFLDLIHFDYYFFLRKFDSNLVEGNLTGNPRFEAINGSYVLDDLKETWDLILGLDMATDWDKLLNVLKAYRDVDVVAPSDWANVVKQLVQLRRSRVLELIIRHLDKNPFYKAQPAVHRDRIVDGYLQKIKTQAELTMQKIIRGQREEKIARLSTQVFGTATVARLRNYTEKANINFRKKLMSGYIHVVPLDYSKAFLLDYFKKDVREVVDLVLIKGKWSTNIMSNQLSEAFHGLLLLTDRLLKFDESLGEDGDLSLKIRGALRRAEKEKQHLSQVRKMLHEVNEMAKGIVVEAAQALIVTAKILKSMIEDHGKKPPDLILNWKELDTHQDNQLKEKMVTVYKHIYYFIQLIQQCLK